ncbi:hypothetical protein B0H13DRAFT_2023291 [Mycena leptocephala]|nr:hypothetical protein B0H13DRAFT_2023291 [Mycena leptocephala]
MQQYPPPPPQRFHSAPHSANPANSWQPRTPNHRSHGKYPAPCIKYPAGGSTTSVWGGSTVRERDSDSDDDDETVAAFSIASSQSRAPGNKPTQQRRVAHWVHDTKHYSSDFKSPFVPRSGTTNASSSVHGHGHQKSDRDRHESHNHHERKREPPPIWIPQPQHTAHHPLRHAVSQPVLAPQPPMQYAQPQMVWMPAHPPPHQGPMTTNGHAQFLAPPRTVTVMHAPHGRSRTESHGRKRSHS